MAQLPIKPRLGKKYPARKLDKNQLYLMLGAIPRNGFWSSYKRAILILASTSGLRISELLDLRPNEIDFSAGTIFVRNGKCGKSRTVGLNSAAVEPIRAWMAARATLKVGEANPLFCAEDGSKASPSALNQMLKRLAKKVGIAQRVSFHQLRHNLAVVLDSKSVPLTQISAILGHAYLSTTEYYLKAINPKHAINTLQVMQF